MYVRNVNDIQNIDLKQQYGAIYPTDNQNRYDQRQFVFMANKLRYFATALANHYQSTPGSKNTSNVQNEGFDLPKVVVYEKKSGWSIGNTYNWSLFGNVNSPKYNSNTKNEKDKDKNEDGAAFRLAAAIIGAIVGGIGVYFFGKNLAIKQNVVEDHEQLIIIANSFQNLGHLRASLVNGQPLHSHIQAIFGLITESNALLTTQEKQANTTICCSTGAIASGALALVGAIFKYGLTMRLGLVGVAGTAGFAICRYAYDSYRTIPRYTDNIRNHLHTLEQPLQGYIPPEMISPCQYYPPANDQQPKQQYHYQQQAYQN